MPKKQRKVFIHPVHKHPTNYTMDEQGFIVYEGDRYFPLKNVYQGYPKITGLPDIEYRENTLSIKPSKLHNRKKIVRIVKTPKRCKLTKLINHDTKKFGSLQIAILGTYLTGKSNLLTCLLSMLLTKKHKIVFWDQSPIESRSLAGHGYFDSKWNFHPFNLTIWIPEHYEFDVHAPAHNPLWNHRNNVFVRRFSKVNQIVDNLKYHEVNTIFSEAFDETSALYLWIDLMQEIRRRVSINDSYVFSMHEFSSLFPEGAEKEMHQAINGAKKIVQELRKNRLGVCCSFHEMSDVSYKVSRKFGYLLQKQPVFKKNYSALEEYCKNFGVTQVAIANGAGFKEHRFSKFPEIEDSYRLIPNENPFVYREGKIYEKITDYKQSKTQVGQLTNARVMVALLAGKSVRKIMDEYQVTMHTVKMVRKALKEAGQIS